MEQNKKTCPYCGEEIMAAARKCRWCGEWLDREPTPRTVNVVEQPQAPVVESTHESVSEKSPINKPLVYAIMVVVAIVSACNLWSEAQWLEFTTSISLGVWTCLFLTLIIAVCAFSIKSKMSPTSMRLWTAIEVLCLSVPFESYAYENLYGEIYLDHELGVGIIITAILGVLTFFLSMFFSGKVTSYLYKYGSILYVLYSIIMYIQDHNG